MPGKRNKQIYRKPQKIYIGPKLTQSPYFVHVNFSQKIQSALSRAKL